MTQYRLVYQLSNRIKEIEINAHSPMEAFKKFKDMMPKIIYNNLSVHEIKVDIEHKVYIKKTEPKLCCPCDNIFDNLFKSYITMSKWKSKVVEVDVDYDISDFDDDEFLEELFNRLKCKKFHKDQIEGIKKSINHLNPYEDYVKLPYKTMDDQMKLDFLKDHWTEFTSFDLEKLSK